jgi:hypothetical protein
VTISQARLWVRQAGFTIRHFGVRYLPVNLAAIPILGEVLAWHVQMILDTDYTHSERDCWPSVQPSIEAETEKVRW